METHVNFMFGYFNKMLYIDLNEEKIEELNINDEVYKKYIGGSGLISYFLSTMPDVKDLLILTVGPLTLDNVPNGGRVVIGFVSPETGLFGETHIGTRFAVELKKCGYDGIIIKGKEKIPSYIYIANDKVNIYDAKKYWGMDILQTISSIRNDLNDKNLKIIAIGPAGERKVKFSVIGNEEGLGGRTGGGAVMGSKNIKAIVIKGNKEIPIAHPNELKELNKKLINKLLKGGEGLRKNGTGGGLANYYSLGNIPIKNFYLGYWNDESINKITGLTLVKNYSGVPFACSLCPIACKKMVTVKGGKYFDSEVKVRGPEYETLTMLGSNLMIDDLEAIIKGNELCDNLGLDTISTGNVIGFIFELAEKGLIDKEIDGIELSWGNAESMLKLIKKIAFREGIGDVLAEGVKAISEKFGGKEFAVQVKGLENPAHDGRAFFAHALSIATMNRGADHLGWAHLPYRGFSIPELNIYSSKNRYEDDENFIKNTIKIQNLMIVYDSLVICKYALMAGLTITDILDLLYHITGLKYMPEDLIRIGNEIWLLQRKINVNLGMKIDDDYLPPRMLHPHSGRQDTKVPPIEKWMPIYYKFRGL
ncbi:MAG: aldehyde ferredoxin oxidoreductase family protein [Caldisphaera sp.]